VIVPLQEPSSANMCPCTYLASGCHGGGEIVDGVVLHGGGGGGGGAGAGARGALSGMALTVFTGVTKKNPRTRTRGEKTRSINQQL
jgi:hypothetical protein